MVFNEKVCARCAGRMVNPTCRECRTRQISVWLNEKEIDDKLKKEMIEKAREIFNEKSAEDIRCLYCEYRTTPICTYCFFFNFEQILKARGISEETIREFGKIFNYKIYEPDSHS